MTGATASLKKGHGHERSGRQRERTPQHAFRRRIVQSPAQAHARGKRRRRKTRHNHANYRGRNPQSMRVHRHVKLKHVDLGKHQADHSKVWSYFGYETP
jgi:hypothetical protein